MWCPQGYHSWNTVLSHLFHTSEEVLSLVAVGGTPEQQVEGKPRLLNTGEFYLLSRGFASNYEEAELTIAITACFLLSNFLLDYPPTLAGPQGQLLAVYSLFCEHKDQFQFCSYGWPIKSQTEFSQFFEFTQDGNFRSQDILDRFSFINGRTGEICVKNGSKEFLKNFKDYHNNDIRNILDLVARLAGHVFCWETFPDDTEYRNFLSCLEVDETFIRVLDHLFGPAVEAENSTVGTSRRPRGRPSKGNLARKAYWELFPNGHQNAGKVWKEVHTEIQEITGVPLDITTLKRAIRVGG